MKPPKDTLTASCVRAAICGLAKGRKMGGRGQRGRGKVEELVNPGK